MYEEQLQSDPNFASNIQKLEEEYQQFVASKKLQEITANKEEDFIYEVPVIVNLVYNPSLTGGYPDYMPYLPDSQIISVFDLVNREINAQDPYTESVPDTFADNVADMQFKFTLDTITRTIRIFAFEAQITSRQQIVSKSLQLSSPWCKMWVF